VPYRVSVLVDESEREDEAFIQNHLDERALQAECGALHQCDLARGGGPVGFAWGAGAQAAQWHSRVGPATRPLC
jgi:hypothetical protein